jgi:hypothetical protein
MKSIRKVAVKADKVVRKGIITSREKRALLKKKDDTVVMPASEYHALCNRKAHQEAEKVKAEKAAETAKARADALAQ